MSSKQDSQVKPDKNTPLESPKSEYVKRKKKKAKSKSTIDEYRAQAHQQNSTYLKPNTNETTNKNKQVSVTRSPPTPVEDLHDNTKKGVQVPTETFMLILRIKLCEKFDATYTFGNKFGSHSVQSRALLQLAKDLELAVVGISFHVGSGIKDPRAYIAAIKQSRRVFDMAAEIGFNMNVLDIGGGFPGAQNAFDFFHEITNVVNESLKEFFPPEEGVDIIAKSGRYVVASAYTSVVNITGKRWFPKKILDRESGKMHILTLIVSCTICRNLIMLSRTVGIFRSITYNHAYSVMAE
ncbi:ornithine decarboxylase 1-like [Mercenaria mercenaria]|uniref:ornithine decarboxylase 1-like n=1 Tax=Mercenaria mercenaria TaxID=6596 RepID=UPI00234E3E72|nr:ornithine decarboxylase 1-like [Mercenaria mercenaria]